MEIKEVRVQVPLACAYCSNVIAPLFIITNNNEEAQHNNEPMIHNEPIVEEPQEVALRRSQRERRSAILNDYVVYLQETKTDLRINDNDPVSFSQAVSYDNFEKWLNIMKEEINSMEHNSVWDLVELPKDCKRVGCKWVFTTKYDSHSNLECYKARLVAKGFTQNDDIDYKETFSPVSRKDSFKTILTLVARYDLELHQIDVKTIFLNEDLDENVYMDQPTGFSI